MIGQRLQVIWFVAPCEDARVDAWMQRLDPAVHHLGESCQLAHRPGVDGRALQRLERAAGGEQLVAKAVQSARKRRQPGLLANGQKCGRQVVPPTAGSPGAGSDTRPGAPSGAEPPPYRLSRSARPPAGQSPPLPPRRPHLRPSPQSSPHPLPPPPTLPPR